MVAPAFGFSVGDFIAGANLLVNVFSAFKESGGASSKYASEVSFLSSLMSTLEHLERQVGSSSAQNDISRDLSKLAQMIRGPLQDFKSFLDKYEASLGQASTKSSLGKAPRTITYTIKDISGKVEKLRRQVEQPLQAVNSLLSLQVIKSIESLPDQPLQPSQCAQIVEAIRVADIPAELDKQIKVLQRYAKAHNMRQDEQLQRIEDLRAKLDSEVSSLQAKMKDLEEATTELATQKGQKEQQDTSDEAKTAVEKLSTALESKTEKLEKGLKKETQLINARRSFLEDKAEMQQIALTIDDDVNYHNSDARASTSWPSATLSAANLAIVLLSSVVSTVAATTVATRNQRAELLMAASSSASTSTSNNQSQAAESQASKWVSDFSSSNSTATSKAAPSKPPPPTKKKSESAYRTTGGLSYFSGDEKLSKLGEPDTGEGSSRDHDNDHNPFHTPGPVVPSSDNNGSADTSGPSGGDSSSGGGAYSGGYSGGDYSYSSDSDDSDSS